MGLEWGENIKWFSNIPTFLSLNKTQWFSDQFIFFHFYFYHATTAHSAIFIVDVKELLAFYPSFLNL